ncbi:protein piccolo isoform X7 [Chaetoceros tenuissimus]|uniref:Protein piccolo isoform X7 n=1 Tax=Chaetoceros tenuissimus TaxID=426638 RepID=A0AAD3H119_9STRA|nr:protein piccolo isoform X7 [Chaetoceros tenuissimus]
MVNEKSFKENPFNRIAAPVVSSKKVDDNIDFIRQQMAKVAASVSKVTASASSLSNDTANEKEVEVGYNLVPPEKARVDKIQENMNNFERVNTREQFSNLFKGYGKVEVFRIEHVYEQFKKVVVKKIPGTPTMTFDTPMDMIEELAMPAITDNEKYHYYRKAILYKESEHLPFLQSRDDKWWYVKLEKEKKMKKKLPHTMKEVTNKMNIYDLNNKHLKSTNTMTEALDFILEYDDTNNGIGFSKLYVSLKTKVYKHRNKGQNFRLPFPANGNGTKFILDLLPPEEDSKPAPQDDGDLKSAPQDDGDSKPAPQDDGDLKSAPQDDGDSKPAPQDDGDLKSAPQDDGDSKPAPQDDGDLKSAPQDDGDSKPAAQQVPLPVAKGPSSRGYKSQADVDVSKMRTIHSYFVGNKVAQPIAQPIAASVAASAAQPIAASVAASAAQPIAASIAASAAQPIAASVAASAAQPIAASVAASAAQPIDVPVPPAQREVIMIEDSEDEAPFIDEEDEEVAIQHSDVDSFDEENWEEEEEEFDEEEFCGDESESSASSENDADSDY